MITFVIFFFNLPLRLKVHSKNMTVGRNGAINEFQCMAFGGIHFGILLCSRILLPSLITHLPRPPYMADHYFTLSLSFFRTQMADEMVIFVFSILVFPVFYSNHLKLFPNLLTLKLSALERSIHSYFSV